jgi:integrase
MKNTTRQRRLTQEQKRALEAYQYAERQEDRYMGSVFVNAHGQRKQEAKTREAYEACKRLGMTHEHGL